MDCEDPRPVHGTSDRDVNSIDTISVVIPVYNEEKWLPACLTSVFDQTVAPAEVIVVDNNCTDASMRLAAGFPVTTVTESTQGIIPARNAGFNHARSAIIARTDADVVLPRTWLERIRAHFTDPSIGAVTGGARFYDLVDTAGRNIVHHLLFFRLTALVLGHYPVFGPNFALRRSLWEQVRHSVCLDDRDVHEDIDLAIHVGRLARIRYDPALTVATSGRRLTSAPGSLLVDYPRRWFKTLFFQTHR